MNVHSAALCTQKPPVRDVITSRTGGFCDGSTIMSLKTSLDLKPVLRVEPQQKEGGAGGQQGVFSGVLGEPDGEIGRLDDAVVEGLDVPLNADQGGGEGVA